MLRCVEHETSFITSGPGVQIFNGATYLILNHRFSSAKFFVFSSSIGSDESVRLSSHMR